MHNYHPLHLEDLKKSGLCGATIDQAGIKAVSRGQINKRLGFNVPDLKSTYEIPYPGCDGFSRYRCFYEEGKTGPKYLQKKDSGNRLYIPPLALSVLANTTKPLYFTEGEKKALKACQEGLYCIGLSGLWNWKNKDEEVLIPDFGKIGLEQRPVYIVPDNDYRKPNKHGYRKNLELAVSRLGHALNEKGATVHIVELPDGEAKGLDDYLCSHTVDEFHKLPLKEVSTLDRVAQEKERHDSKTERLIKLVMAEAQLFHDADMKAFATIQRDGHRETYPLRSKGFRIWLSGRLWKERQEGCSVQIMQDILGTLE